MQLTRSWSLGPSALGKISSEYPDCVKIPPNKACTRVGKLPLLLFLSLSAAFMELSSALQCALNVDPTSQKNLVIILISPHKTK